jgi:hypothetical protein
MLHTGPAPRMRASGACLGCCEGASDIPGAGGRTTGRSRVSSHHSGSLAHPGGGSRLRSVRSEVQASSGVPRSRTPWIAPRPTALVSAPAHRGRATGAHLDYAVGIASRGRLHVGPVNMREPQKTGSAQLDATQRLVIALAPRVNSPGRCSEAIGVRPRTGRCDRCLAHGREYPTVADPFSSFSTPARLRSPSGTRTSN